MEDIIRDLEPRGGEEGGPITFPSGVLDGVVYWRRFRTGGLRRHRGRWGQ